MMKYALVMIVLLFGCDGPIDSVSMRGIVTKTHDDNDGLANACMTVFDREGDEYSHTTTSESGSFMVDIPAEQTVHVIVTAEGHTPASFSGSGGALPGLSTEVGDLHGMPTSDTRAWRDLFSGCPGSFEGSFIVGEVMLLDMVDTVFGEPVLVTTAYAIAENEDGDEFEACYLNAQGDSVNPDAFATGEAGTFALFGLSEGTHSLTVGYTMLGAEVYRISWEVWVPQDGVVPRFPIWVESVL